MDSIRSILTLLEHSTDEQPAFDAAMLLAKRFGSGLSCCWPSSRTFTPDTSIR